MTTRQRIRQELQEAMRAGNNSRKQTFRLLLSSIQLADVEKGVEVDDQVVLSIIQKEIKMRKESIEGAQQANRSDLVAQSLAEIEILTEFLPKQLSDEELLAIIKETVQELGVTTPNQTGLVMKTVMPKVQGRAPGDKISKILKDLLTNKE